MIAHPKDRVSTLPDVQALPFFQGTKFSSLRETPAPFVPMLDGETDVGYFDSFESAEDMAKYAEVFKKQRDVEAVEERGLGNRNNWVCLSTICSISCRSTGWLLNQHRLVSHSARTLLRQVPSQDHRRNVRPETPFRPCSSPILCYLPSRFHDCVSLFPVYPLVPTLPPSVCE